MLKLSIVIFVCLSSLGCVTVSQVTVTPQNDSVVVAVYLKPIVIEK